MPMGAVAMDESQTPPNLYLLEYILTLAIAAVVGTIAYKSAQSPKNLLASAGVSVRKVARAVTEIERKTFHLAGLLVPLIHQLMLSNGFSNASCVRLCWAITITGVCADCLRLKVDVVRRNWPMRQLLREHEQKQMTGGSSFSLGCTLTIAISPPSIAMASVLFLILGDMCAAVIGVSFGHEACTLKLGRSGKKSIEGSVAMFAVCFLVGAEAGVQSAPRAGSRTAPRPPPPAPPEGCRPTF